MDISKTLKEQSVNELSVLKKEIGELIKKKEAEDTTALWVVEDLWDTFLAFPADQFWQAAQKMSELVLVKAKEKPNTDLSLNIRYAKVRNSEVEKYLAMGTDET